ncbi:hypothetical protein B0H13DRAFT_2393317 [Mycena leptocephala]|nr:hypothetical protein B0H13DRAFT_2393317 [Mycena leptocephala]
MQRLSRAKDLDEDDTASVRRLKRRESCKAYDAAHRVERNLKKKDRMAILRAQRAQDPPDIAEARRLAARETARKYRERNRERLAQKARTARGRAKVRARTTLLKMIRHREREILRLPMVVPSTWSLERRQETFNAREASKAREAEVLSSEDEDADSDVGDAEEEDEDNESGGVSATSATRSILPQASLQQGERFADIDYVLLESNAGETRLLPVSYDLACQWGGNFQARAGGALSPGAYEDWIMADLQYKSVSNASIKSYYDWIELKSAWHTRCDAGEHDHPAAPSLTSSAPTTPQRTRTAGSQNSLNGSSTAGPSSSSVSRTPRGANTPPPPLPVHIIESRSPSPDLPPSRTPPPPPPAYTPHTTPSAQSNPSVSVGPVGLMCYAVRVGTEGETFTDPEEARERFFALQGAGKNPGFVAAASLSRCMRWIEGSPPATNTTWTPWIEREDRARRRRVADQ